MKLFLFYFIISFYLIQSYKDDYDLLYEWGKNNSVFISPKISMNYTNSNTKNFYVNKKIKSGEIIISIPKNAILDIDTALKYSDSNIKTQYEVYQKEKLDNNLNIYEVDEDRKEHAFLAYLMTIANKKKSKKNKFYQHFKYYFNTFETNIEHLPIFYDSDQIKIILFSLLGKGIIQTKKMVEEEHELFQSKIYKKFINSDEYIKYRMFTYKKINDVSNLNGLVPFVDFLEKNPVNYNLQLNYSLSEKILHIYATKDIKKNEKLVLYIKQISNIRSFLMYGEIYEENKEILDIFRIPLISLYFKKKNNLDSEFAKGEVVDLMEQNYYEKAVPLYMKLTKVFNKEESKASALSLFLENIIEIRKIYDLVNLGILFENFYENIYVEKIMKILETEKNCLDLRINELKKIINKLSGEENDSL